MTSILQPTADGLMLGGVFALSAIGFSLIYGVLHVVNLTHGVTILLGAYLSFSLAEEFGLDPIVAIPIVMAILFVVGYAYQRFLIQRVHGGRSVFPTLLLTFAVALIVKNLLIVHYSSSAKVITPRYAFDSLSLGPVHVDVVRLAALAISLVLLLALTIVLKRTSFGRIMRAKEVPMSRRFPFLALLTAFGTGWSLVPATIVAVKGVPAEQNGLASGVVNTSRLVGGTLGLAVLSTLATSHTNSLLASGHGTFDALTDGYKLAFMISAGICALGILAAATLIRRSPSPVPQAA